MAEEESLVSRRSKRSTAGNRMEVALAELTFEEPQDPEEDIEFIVDKEEEDVFESDFASTDEEAAQEDVDEVDRTAREEERRVRKTARARVEKATAAAHARQRVTFNPEATSSQLKSRLTQKPKRRVSLGVAVNAETGEVIDGGAGMVGVKRHSQRRYTVLNTSATVNRIKDAEEKRAAVPKKTKMATRLPTQDELIARALDTEEGNITEHRDYLRLEEEKRAKARVVKQAIEGPVLRWVSKKETIQVEVQAPPPPPPPTTTAMGANFNAAKYSFVYTPGVGAGTVGSQAYSMPFYAYTPFTAQSTVSKPQEASTSVLATASSYSSGNPQVSSAGPSTAPTSLTSPSAPLPLPSSSPSIQDSAAHAVSSVPSALSWQQRPQTQPPAQAQPQPQPQAQTQSSAQPQPLPVLLSYPPVPTAPLISHRSEDVCKNYVIHELSQSIPSNPTWKDTMTAMFGDHVKWDEVKVFMGKGRPMARPVRTCLITGQPAKYRDPRTNVPFANIGAYDVLTRVLGRGYVWCSELGCYVGVSETSRKHTNEEAKGGAGVGMGMVEDVAGRQEDGDTGAEAEAGELEDRTTKRPRVEITDG